jgi:acyl dehydratase
MINPVSLKVGDSLPAMNFPPITRTTLALYCGGSGDHNPIHVDIDFARRCGLNDVIAHGMLIKAYIGRALTAAIDQQFLTQFDTQFMAPTLVRDEITVSLAVDSIESNGGLIKLVIKAEARNQNSVTVARSMAIFQTPETSIDHFKTL